MKLSVVICTYNRERYIYECLSRLIKNKFHEDWELILVDNNSTDNTKLECARFETDYQPSNYKYVLEINQGLSFARNRGIRESTGDWIIFLDDDAYVTESYLLNIHQCLCSYPDAGAFGGAIIPVFEGEEPDWLNPWSRSYVSALNLGENVSVFKKGKYPIGANMGISKNVFEQVGCFNTRLGRTSTLLLGGEEKDIFYKIRQAGFPIYYFPKIGVYHNIPQKRTTFAFVERLGLGVGISERHRTLSISKINYVFRLLSECGKWGGTFILFMYYLFKRQSSKGRVLLIFRKNVTLGLLHLKVMQ